MKQIFISTALILTATYTLTAQHSNHNDSLLTLGNPSNIVIEFGKPSYGANSFNLGGEAPDVRFGVHTVVPAKEGYCVYGISRSDKGNPQVWRALTDDGYSFKQTKMLFELPPSRSGTPWLTSQLSVGRDRFILIQVAKGKFYRRGHYFYSFASQKTDSLWRPLQKEPIYQGQDALSIVWNNQLSRFVNYQTAYQILDKRYKDNISPVRRVLHIRTSEDGKTWFPGSSFGIDGPYLSQQEIIVPDSLDTEDTEFYKFNAINLGEFWAGIMVKYVAQPTEFPSLKPWPHGPFLSYEWWISSDGLNWERPFRETSNLDNAPYALAYRLHKPLQFGNELRWIADQKVYTMNRNRMFSIYSRANADVVTKPLQLNGKPLTLEVEFFNRNTDNSKYKNALTQGYIIAELVNSSGNVVKGFEREKCIIRTTDEEKIVLKWGEKHLPDSYGKDSFRLRISFRDVKLYSLSY